MNFIQELSDIHEQIENMSNEALYRYLTRLSYIYHIAAIERDNRLMNNNLETKKKK